MRGEGIHRHGRMRGMGEEKRREIGGGRLRDESCTTRVVELSRQNIPGSIGPDPTSSDR